MKSILFAFLFIMVMAISSCHNEPESPVVDAGHISLVIGNPLDVGIKDIILFPVGGNYNPAIHESDSKNNAQELNSNLEENVEGYMSKNEGSFKFDRTASSEYYNKKEENFDIRNLLFYNKTTGVAYPLAKDTLHILSFAIHNEFSRPLIFFRIVKKDINVDRKYNSKDAVMLFISDPDGKNLVQVTPENEQFFDYFYYPDTHSILAKTAIDIDNDKKFTMKDETNFREVKLDHPAYGREIFSQGLKDSLKMFMH